MLRFASSLKFAARLNTACLIGLYAAVALLGPGGLHAVAPRGAANCCQENPACDSQRAEPSHRGCSHQHAETPAESHGGPENGPAPCRDGGCAICEFAATQAMPAAIVESPAPLEPAGQIEPALNLRVAARTVAAFRIRGPPAVV